MPNVPAEDPAATVVPPPAAVRPLATVLRGAAIGAADLVPGVSGGTMALILGIYPRLIQALAALSAVATLQALRRGRLRVFWRRLDGTFLAYLAAGVAIAILTMARALTWTLEHHPVLLYAAFFGTIAASIPVVLAHVRARLRVAALWSLPAAALALVLVTAAPTTTPDHALAYLAAGAIGVSALLLPGVSGAFLLVLLGKYEPVLQAVVRLDLTILAPFAVGLMIGVVGFARAVAAALRRWPSSVLGVLAGFLAGSLPRVWPWHQADGARLSLFAPASLTEAALVLAIMVAAAAAVTMIGRHGAGSSLS